jgi:hypothetical protein
MTLKTLTKVFAGAVATLLIMAAPLQAQVFPRGNGISLADKDQFDMYVQISDWQDMRQDLDSFRLTTLRQFEQNLQEQGVRRRPGRSYLVCNVQAVLNRNQIAYNTTIEYWELESTKVNWLQWAQSSLNVIAANRFDEELVAEECSSRFMAEWKRWNP